MMRISDPGPEEIEKVRQIILQFDPDESDVIDEDCLMKATYYLHWNGYLEDEVIATEAKSDRSSVYFVYDVLKWTEENT